MIDHLKEMFPAAVAKLRSAVMDVPEDERGDWLHYLDFNLKRYYHTAGLIRSEPVLEIGAYPFQMSSIIQTIGCQVDPTDVHPNRLWNLTYKLGVTPRRLDIQTPTEEDLVASHQRYGTIVFCEVFEHLGVNPLRALEVCRLMLKPGKGNRLIFSTPAVRFRERLRFFIGRDYQADPVRVWGEAARKLGHSGHVRVYTRREVVRMLKHVGFRIVDIYNFQRWLFVVAERA